MEGEMLMRGRGPGVTGGQRVQQRKLRHLTEAFLLISTCSICCNNLHHCIQSSVKFSLQTNRLELVFLFKDITKCQVLLQSGPRTIAGATHRVQFLLNYER